MSRSNRIELIDRDRERKEFVNLLACNDDRRILAIQDDKDTGKTHLLEAMKKMCKERDFPVCLIDLSTLDDITPHSFVKNIAENLHKVPLHRFNRFESAITHNDIHSIYRYTSIDGRVDLSGANLSNAQNVKVAGTYVEHQHFYGDVQLNPEKLPELTLSQREEAKKTSIQAFFDDLREYCVKTDKPIVLLLDAYEKCYKPEGVSADKWKLLERWMVHEFMRCLFFDMELRPTKLVLVVAGREIHDFDEEFPRTSSQVMTLIDELSQWELDHVEECFKKIDYDYQPDDVEKFFHFVSIGLPVGEIINSILLVKNRRERKAKKRR